ncbi:hypothetical protein PCANC_07989 [Puccinia coronata f. sp. avenae]|uniref:Uncharacterized protein n=1 Tax=Puccinia coronata f. sp. avenae TaxID=200324 RepID=A0A2N5UGW6_9BASI|nr:hypothetical protein PCANC_07989 [Puccinia coronata f. sp. avenae]PLW36983.1 hypothetical protein PCASD_06640 [Puccinia coronata f. sp. avenae]
MAMAYRRYSNDSPSWNRNATFPPLPGAVHNRAPSPAFMNPRTMPNSQLPYKTSIIAAPSFTKNYRPSSENSTLYQSTSKAIASPDSIPPVTEEAPVIEERSNLEQTRILEVPKEKIEIKQDNTRKGKEPAIVRTRPIFHANLEEARKYHENRLKNLSAKRTPVSCEEIVSRYCDQFNFQLPTLEVIRYKESAKRRVFLRIKRRLVGIGEGQTTFEAMLAAYDDTVLYLFNGDAQLKQQLLQPNETIEWNHRKKGSH